MIIWINGAFGVGKTTIAKELHKMMVGSFIYDPENAGNFIRENFPDSMWKDDFQDYSLWREINYKMIFQLACDYHQPIIVPMTLIKTASFDETVGKLINASINVKHFILTADKTTLYQRLLRRGEKTDSWCVQQVEKCIFAFQNSINGIKIDTVNRTIDSIVMDIKKAL